MTQDSNRKPRRVQKSQFKKVDKTSDPANFTNCVLTEAFGELIRKEQDIYDKRVDPDNPNAEPILPMRLDTKPRNGYKEYVENPTSASVSPKGEVSTVRKKEQTTMTATAETPDLSETRTKADAYAAGKNEGINEGISMERQRMAAETPGLFSRMFGGIARFVSHNRGPLMFVAGATAATFAGPAISSALGRKNVTVMVDGQPVGEVMSADGQPAPGASGDQGGGGGRGRGR